MDHSWKYSRGGDGSWNQNADWAQYWSGVILNEVGRGWSQEQLGSLLTLNCGLLSRSVLIKHSFFLLPSKGYSWENISLSFLKFKKTKRYTRVLVRMWLGVFIGLQDCTAILSTATDWQVQPHFQSRESLWPISLRMAPGQYYAQSCFWFHDQLWPVPLRRSSFAGLFDWTNFSRLVFSQAFTSTGVPTLNTGPTDFLAY